jgi:SecY interacting protein Syd
MKSTEQDLPEFENQHLQQKVAPSLANNDNDENLKAFLWRFSQTYIREYQQQKGSFPLAEIDPESQSPCQLVTQNDDKTTWQPVKISPSLDFKNISAALSIAIHADVEDYFCSIYADSIAAKSDDGALSLLFAWNIDDFKRLQENIIGHIMMKQRLNQAITIFFALTDEEDTILSIDNDSGAIWVERVGCEPHKKVADSMQEFLSNLSFELSA